MEDLEADQTANSSQESPIDLHFRENIKRDKTVKFVVAFKKDQTVLGESRTRAIIQLQVLERKFHQNPTLKAEYSAAMQYYLDNGYMNVVDQCDLEDGYYMPHHAVVKSSSTTTKTRVVFNCLLQPQAKCH